MTTEPTLIDRVRKTIASEAETDQWGAQEQDAVLGRHLIALVRQIDAAQASGVKPSAQVSFLLHAFNLSEGGNQIYEQGQTDALAADAEPIDDDTKTDSGEDETDAPIQTVTIPSHEQHGGFQFNTVTVKLRWVCPVCGRPRGEIDHRAHSYDGSRRLIVDGWENPCQHSDSYAAVRKEAATNGLNSTAKE